MQKIALLSCGRSDFSIYRKLILALEANPEIDLTVIAFSTHLSPYHGMTVSQIEELNLNKIIKLDTLLANDDVDSVATSMGLTTMRMADIWKHNSFDKVIALGDRFEMFAAASSAVPFNLPIAHIHGGEKTMGAIDNAFRHAISAMSAFHFTTCLTHQKRVQEIVEIEEEDNVYNVGSLALQNLEDIEFYTTEEFKAVFDIDLSIPTILMTYHPETFGNVNNEINLKIILQFLDEIDEQVLITLPNNDPAGSEMRQQLLNYAQRNNHVKCYDFLGFRGYFSAIQHCLFMLGNSSSGIIEAASFGRWVINVGDRQKGRQQSGNIFDVGSDLQEMFDAYNQIKAKPQFTGENIYAQPNTVERIVQVLLSE